MRYEISNDDYWNFTCCFSYNQIYKRQKYADLIEGLEDDNEYPLKDFYVIGFSMNDNSIFKIHDKNKDELISQAKLLYDEDIQNIML